MQRMFYKDIRHCSPVAAYAGYNPGHAMNNKDEAMFILKYQ